MGIYMYPETENICMNPMTLNPKYKFMAHRLLCREQQQAQEVQGHR